MATSIEIAERMCVNKRTPPGILRLDFAKPRKLSAEFKFSQGEPTSPQPSVDRLSVTFAEESVKSDSSTRCNYFNPVQPIMDKMNLPQAATEDDESDQEDYSASVNAIMLRRQSTKRTRRRRTSSPFSPDILPGTENGRRRSSVFTTSSGDTAISMDENLAPEVTQEEIFENIKLHKEVLSNVKMQPWNMRKKLKLVIQAKAYVKKHEGALQERLAHSHSTRDMLARWRILIVQKWQHWRREIMNLSMWFIPWELKIKEIESHFGSAVASYFIFLRWLFWVNTVISVVLISFVAIPEMLVADPKAAGDRKFILKEERYNATNFMTLWEFEGVLKYSPLFYGWYTNSDPNAGGYRLPFAYFVTGLMVYAYSFFATLRKMAENSRMSKLSEKDDEYVFSWKLFTAWDYMIGNAETAHNRVASIVMGFKEALLEEAEKKKDTRNWKVICFRVLVNTVVLGLLSFSVFAVVMVVKRSTEPEANSNFWRKNEITIVMSLITLVFPMIFEVLGFLEQYHPRKQLRLQLARIMVLNLLNLYSLIFALIDKISDMSTELLVFKNLSSAMTNAEATIPTTTTSLPDTTNVQPYFQKTQCYQECVDVYEKALISANLITGLAQNISEIAFPKLAQFVTDLSSNYSVLNHTIFDLMNVTDVFDFINDTDVFDNYTTSNLTTIIFQNDSYANTTLDTYTQFSVEDLKDMFIDYLSYILYPFKYYNGSILDGNTTTMEFDHTLIVSTTVAPDNYDVFKSTVLPILTTNTTEFLDNERFDFELTTIYKELMSTVSTLQENITISNCMTICDEESGPYTLNQTTTTPFSVIETSLNYSMRARLRSLCWETMFGQELIKLTVMDLIMTIIPTLAIDFFRGIFVRVMNRCWCWDLEKTFPQYGDFKVAENILSLVNNQGMVWMGMFFSPGLVLFNVIKLYIMMYFRAWAVLTCNAPPEVIFRASRSNNFYYALLLMMLFLCVLPVGYAIVWIKPSWHCGPFSQYTKIFHIFTKTIKNNVPVPVQQALDYIASPGIVIPLLVLLILIIYYLVSLTNALRGANEELKIQLKRERTEERRKMFQLADRRRRGGSGESNDTPFNKWKKLLGQLPSGKSLDDTPKQETEEIPPPIKEEKTENKSKDFFSKLIKRALGKSSTSEEEANADDGTDTEQHDSLPDDTIAKPHKPVKHVFSWGSNDFQSIANRAIQMKKNQAMNDSSLREPVDRGEQKHVQLRRSSDLKRPLNRKDSFIDRNDPSTSRAVRQDSETSSIWSDNIPVITISKTESAENILDKNYSENKDKEEPVIKFKPKVRCALTKQSAEIDEDTICYFNKDLEKTRIDNEAIRNIVENDYENNNRLIEETEHSPEIYENSENFGDYLDDPKSTEALTDRSSSEDTEHKESSVDTVLNSPYMKDYSS